MFLRVRTTAFEMIWNMSQVNLPSDVKMTCEWGDDTANAPDDEPFNMTNPDTANVYPILHEYLAQGDYTYSCTMANRVSNMTFTRNV